MTAPQRLQPDGRALIMPLIKGLLERGWKLHKIPSTGQIQRNRQRLVLEFPDRTLRFRLLVYKVTQSSRNRPEERRVEVTSTYAGGNLPEEPGFEDIVLGFDAVTDVYVGFDARRLHQGGSSHNASSFFDRSALTSVSENELLVLPRTSHVLGVERHVYFRPSDADLYLPFARPLHDGEDASLGTGSVRPPKTARSSAEVPSTGVVGCDIVLAAPDTPGSRMRGTHAVEDGRLVRGLEEGLPLHHIGGAVSPLQLQRALRRRDENGRLGEQFVLTAERNRLIRSGRHDLANNVCWVSQENVAAGYDILSYEFDGTERLIEVKSTEGSGHKFHMTVNEWRVAEEAKEMYHIARVRRVRDEPQVEWFTDPRTLERAGQLRRDATTFQVRVRSSARRRRSERSESAARSTTATGSMRARAVVAAGARSTESIRTNSRGEE